jgi:hypothetical protein
MARKAGESKKDAPPHVRLAGSLEDAGQNDVLYVSAKGEVLSPLRYWVTAVVATGVLVPLCGAITVLLFLALGPFGLLLSAAFSLWVLASVMIGVRLRRGILLLAGGRIERSLEVLRGVASSWLAQRASRGIAEEGMAIGLAIQGQHEESLRHSRAALARLRGWTPNPQARVYREVARHGEITMLATLGRMGEAKALFAGLGPVPEGEYLRLYHFTTELYLAFLGGSLTMEEDALYERARMGLSTTTATALLALSAWGYEKRGDREMFEHLLRPALERAPGRKLAGPMPRLAAWMKERGESLAEQRE